MIITNIPIVDFYIYCLESAYNNGFKWVLCFLGREADSEITYKQIQRYWSSIHDLTKNQILFVFAGIIEYNDKNLSILSYEDSPWCGIQNEAIRFVDKNSLTLPYSVCRTIDNEKRKFDKVAINHTCSVSELRDYFRLSEKDVPALIFTPTWISLQKRHIKVSIKSKDIYKELKDIVQILEEPLKELEEVKEKYSVSEKYLQGIRKQINEFDQKSKIQRQYIYSKIELDEILNDNNYGGDKELLIQAMKMQKLSDWQVIGQYTKSIDRSTKSILKKYLKALKKKGDLDKKCELDIINLKCLLSEEHEYSVMNKELIRKSYDIYDEMIKKIENYSAQFSLANNNIEDEIKNLIFTDVNLKKHEKNSFEAALDILNIFKEWVEANRGWNLIQNTICNRREKDIQRLIHLVAKSYVEFQNLDISFEANAGRGPLDFKVSRGNDKTIVEIKLSTNGQYLHGYEKQIVEYGKAENTNKMIFMFIDLGNPRRLKKIIAVHDKNIIMQKRVPVLIIVDGTTKKTASTI